MRYSNSRGVILLYFNKARALRFLRRQGQVEEKTLHSRIPWLLPGDSRLQKHDRNDTFPLELTISTDGSLSIPILYHG